MPAERIIILQTGLGSSLMPSHALRGPAVPERKEAGQHHAVSVLFPVSLNNPDGALRYEILELSFGVVFPTPEPSSLA